MKKTVFKILSVVVSLVLLLTLVSCTKKTVVKNEDETSSKSVSENSGDKSMVSITVPEGYTLLKTAWLLEEKGLCRASDFITATQNYDISKYPILASLKEKDTCFKLEGYLYPATYKFKKGTLPDDIIKAMLDAFSKTFGADFETKAKTLGKSVHEIITIASLIEKEAKTDEQRPMVSSILYNRLKINMPLQLDCTISYCTGVIKEYYPDKLDHYKYLYNTYRCKALPNGAIGSPGLASIKAALNPTQTDYIYFVIGTKAPYEAAYTKDYKEHLANYKRIEKPNT